MYACARVNIKIKRNLFDSLVHQEIGFFDVTKTGITHSFLFKMICKLFLLKVICLAIISGEITSRLTADCDTMSATIATNLNVFLRNAVMFVGSLIMMFKLSWEMTTVTFAAMPLIAVVSKVYGGYFDVSYAWP